MVFRRNEAIDENLEQAVKYLTPKSFSREKRQKLRYYIEDLTIRLGPVIDRYPSWHPLVCNHNKTQPVTYPSEQCGYHGLDHTVCFANGFISCPYHDGQRIIDSVNKISNNNDAYLRYSHIASIEVERLDQPLYNESTDPILVYCNWTKALNIDNTIPKNIAIGLMLEEQVPCWRQSKYGEIWETMRPYFMGEPCGKRSSLFINQETGQTMKKVHEAIIYSGMFGPLYV